ncbi:MAG: PHP domain-containing protein [Parachlamydiales bacterium]|nr:PHP domain-containing protein [Parachlamydiales bacterium]
MSFRADLHVHSYFSDGTMSPIELLNLAKEKNINAISITDHDTIEAYSDAVFQHAHSIGVQLMLGVEISSELFNENVHILGYNFDITNKSFKDFLKKVVEKREQRNRKILEKLKNFNIDISEEELEDFTKKIGASKTTIGRPHISQLMQKKGITETFQEGFDKYFNDKGPCYVPGFKFSPKEVIEEIHKCSGIAVLAHPHFIRNRKIFDYLLENNIDGIEVYYAKLLPNIEARWERFAVKHNLLITGGSDYHGDIKPFNSLGSSWVDLNHFNKLNEQL